jgi:hypothetical protein
VLFYHGNNLPKALADLFPDIGIDRSKFQKSLGNKKKRQGRGRREEEKVGRGKKEIEEDQKEKGREGGEQEGEEGRGKEKRKIEGVWE